MRIRDRGEILIKYRDVMIDEFADMAANWIAQNRQTNGLGDALPVMYDATEDVFPHTYFDD